MSPRIVHLGLGNFHRAHQAVYTRDAGDDWTITGVAHRSRRVVDALRRQQMRYTVVTIDGSSSVVEPVDVVTEALTIADDAAAVVARIAAPDTHIVSLTVTEAGYALRPDGRLDLDAVRADLRPGAVPGTALGVLARGLAARAAADGAPVTVLSCDNLPANGDVLRRALSSFADAASLPELAGYLDVVVGFPSTMVDRIVPATTAVHVAAARAAGYDDDVPVPAEPFRQWVMQPSFAAARPAWERAGAVVTEDVHAWETVKVRLLNGSHSLIAYLGLLRGHDLIAHAYADPSVRAAADLLAEEYLPTLTVPAELDLPRYRADLARRFGNAALGHRTAQVGTDGSLKLAQRVPVPAVWHLSRGTVPGALALLVAAYLQCLTRPLPGGAPPPPDPATARLADLARTRPGGNELATAVLVDDARFGPDLARYPAFAARVGELLDAMSTHGPTAAIGSVVADRG